MPAQGSACQACGHRGLVGPPCPSGPLPSPPSSGSLPSGGPGKEVRGGVGTRGSPQCRMCSPGQGWPGSDPRVWLLPVPDRVHQRLRVPRGADGRRPWGLRQGGEVPLCAQPGPVQPRRQDHRGLQHLVSRRAWLRAPCARGKCALGSRPGLQACGLPRGRPRCAGLRAHPPAPPLAGRVLPPVRVLGGTFRWWLVRAGQRGARELPAQPLQAPVPLSSAPVREGAGPAARRCATAPAPSTGTATTSPSTGGSTTLTGTAPTLPCRCSQGRPQSPPAPCPPCAGAADGLGGCVHGKGPFLRPLIL